MRTKNIITTFTCALFLSTLSAHKQPVYQSVNDYPVPNSPINEADYSPVSTTFRVWAPAAKKAWVSVSENKQGASEHLTKMKLQANGLWTVTIHGDMLGKLYRFEILNGKVKESTVGIFAKALTANGERAAIVDMSKTDPTGWSADVRPSLAKPSDLTVYELHYRDMSMHPSSGMTHQGKFLALTEQGTHNPEGQSTGLDHIKELGVNAVQIMPSFDFGSIDEMANFSNNSQKGDVAATSSQRLYNWGYDPENYNAPEGSYSTNPSDPSVRIKEMKTMIQALHKNGIRVIMDVVYNHTFAIKGSNFHITAPGYFYRYKADGTPADGSGCGNETASERGMMRKFMVESVCYWVREYHVDGFRFDLMAIHDMETMREIRKALDEIDPSITIYGEGWAAGAPALPESQLALKKNIYQLDRIGAFGDELRDALRGPFSDDRQGAFLAGIAGEEESVKFGIVGGIAHPDVNMSKVNYSNAPWTNNPSQMVSYVSCHDDMCLADRLRAELPNADEAELLRLDKLAQTAVFTSQGIPFILCGEEVFRSKKGVHNSFSSPDSINEIDWNNKSRYHDLYQYYRGLVEMRRLHPAFRLGSAVEVRNNLHFLKTEVPCVVAYTVKGSNEELLVVLNGNKNPSCVDVPDGQWRIIASNGEIDNTATKSLSGGAVTIAAQTALILVRSK